MKILVVCQYYYPEPFRISDICETLVKNGHHVTVLTGLPNYPEGRVLDEFRKGRKRDEIVNGVRVIRNFEVGRGKGKLKLFLNYVSFAVSASMKAFFLKEKFDVVFVNQLSPVLMGIPAIVYKRMKNTKIVLYCLDLWPDSLAAGGVSENSFVYGAFLRISRWIYQSVDSILVSSKMFNQYFRSILEVNADIKHLPQYAEDIYSIESKIAKKNKQNDFVFAGNIGDMQSVDTIIRAANELRDNSDITFHIVGDGSRLEECKELSKAFGLKNVVFYGRRPITEMPDIYNMADAMLITLKNNKNLSYTLPGKIQSYMAAGKPIIGAINGETKLVIGESGAGLCVEAEDYRGLAEAIRRFCNSEHKEKMASSSYDYYLRNYRKESFISVLENALESMGE